MIQQRVLGSRQRLTAITVAGLYRLPALTLRLAEILLLLWLGVYWDTWTLGYRHPAVWMLAVVWLLQLTLLPPLRLGRIAWEQALVAGKSTPSLRLLWRGFRCWGSAIAWRWHLWWRRWLVGGVVLAPTTLLWGWGSYLTTQGDATPAPLLLLGLGILLLPLELTGAWLWFSRYSLTELFLLEGYPALAAMQLSARGMAGKTRQYVNFWGGQLGRLAACLLVLPAPAMLSALRWDRARWLWQCRRVTKF